MTRHLDGTPVVHLPWALRLTLVLGLIVWIFALVGVRSLLSQVTADVTLQNNIAELSVGPVATPHRVSILLYRDGGAAVLGDSVRALVSPREFTLQPNVVQTVRIRIDEQVVPGELLRVATLFVPVDSTTSQTVALRVAMRLVTKIRAAP
jgi:hypothetical protein